MGDQVTPQTSEQSIERWRRIAAAVTFRAAWPWKTRIEVVASDLVDGIEVRTALRSPDIVSGEVQWVHMHEVVPERMLHEAGDADAARLIRSLLLRLVEHEFDECLLLAGEQVRDPHARDRAWQRFKGAA